MTTNPTHPVGVSSPTGASTATVTSHLTNTGSAAQLLALVTATPPTQRWALIDHLADAITQATPQLPPDQVCTCGTSLAAPDAQGYSLDYSTGWQPIQHTHDDEWTGTTYTNDQHTVAALMCPTCNRLYNLPPTHQHHLDLDPRRKGDRREHHPDEGLPLLTSS